MLFLFFLYCVLLFNQYIQNVTIIYVTVQLGDVTVTVITLKSLSIDKRHTYQRSVVHAHLEMVYSAYARCIEERNRVNPQNQKRITTNGNRSSKINVHCVNCLHILLPQKKKLLFPPNFILSPLFPPQKNPSKNNFLRKCCTSPH